MASIGVICDLQPRYLRGGHAPQSLLTLPMGTEHLFNHIVRALADHDFKDVRVVPAFDPFEGYHDRLASCVSDTFNVDITVIEPENRADQFLDGEPSDTLLFADPRHWPVRGYEFSELLRIHREQFGAVFMLAAEQGRPRSNERILTDAAGNIRRVQRLFDRTMQGQTDGAVVPCCVLPFALAFDGLQFPLSALRQCIVSQSAPIRDVSAESKTLDLTHQQQLLQLMDSELAGPSRSTPGKSDHDTATTKANADRIAPGASVAGGAKLVGEVVVHSGARIAEGATIIGPSIIGRGATVGSDATVTHAIVVDRAVVLTGHNVHDCVYQAERLRPHETPEADDAIEPPCEPEDHFGVVEDGRFQDVTQVAPALGDRFSLVAKRAFDILAASMGLLALGPLLITVAILVKITSRGPAFFAHQREGKGGKEFGCVKFRTMRTDAHDLQRVLAEQNQADGPQFFIEHDPRITWLGRILRKTNIDELPQLFNVLMGHMSLVGPRPSPFRENQICAPWRTARLSVRPGITGLWQVCRSERDTGDFHQWIHYDLMYVRRFSLWLDVKIIWLTLCSIVTTGDTPIERVFPAQTPRQSAT